MARAFSVAAAMVTVALLLSTTHAFMVNHTLTALEAVKGTLLADKLLPGKGLSLGHVLNITAAQDDKDGAVNVVMSALATKIDPSLPILVGGFTCYINTKTGAVVNVASWYGRLCDAPTSDIITTKSFTVASTSYISQLWATLTPTDELGQLTFKVTDQSGAVIVHTCGYGVGIKAPLMSKQAALADMEAECAPFVLGKGGGVLAKTIKIAQTTPKAAVFIDPTAVLQTFGVDMRTGGLQLLPNGQYVQLPRFGNGIVGIDGGHAVFASDSENTAVQVPKYDATSLEPFVPPDFLQGNGVYEISGIPPGYLADSDAWWNGLAAGNVPPNLPINVGQEQPGFGLSGDAGLCSVTTPGARTSVGSMPWTGYTSAIPVGSPYETAIAQLASEGAALKQTNLGNGQVITPVCQLVGPTGSCTATLLNATLKWYTYPTPSNMGWFVTAAHCFKAVGNFISNATRPGNFEWSSWTVRCGNPVGLLNDTTWWMMPLTNSSGSLGTSPALWIADSVLMPNLTVYDSDKDIAIFAAALCQDQYSNQGYCTGSTVAGTAALNTGSFSTANSMTPVKNGVAYGRLGINDETGAPLMCQKAGPADPTRETICIKTKKCRDVESKCSYVPFTPITFPRSFGRRLHLKLGGAAGQLVERGKKAAPALAPVLDTVVNVIAPIVQPVAQAVTPVLQGGADILNKAWTNSVNYVGGRLSGLQCLAQPCFFENCWSYANLRTTCKQVTLNVFTMIGYPGQTSSTNLTSKADCTFPAGWTGSVSLWGSNGVTTFCPIPINSTAVVRNNTALGVTQVFPGTFAPVNGGVCPPTPAPASMYYSNWQYMVPFAESAMSVAAANTAVATGGWYSKGTRCGGFSGSCIFDTKGVCRGIHSGEGFTNGATGDIANVVNAYDPGFTCSNRIGNATGYNAPVRHHTAVLPNYRNSSRNTLDYGINQICQASGTGCI